MKLLAWRGRVRSFVGIDTRGVCIRQPTLSSLAAGIDSEAEVLLFPGTQLEVIDVATIAPGLYQVHLKEIAVPMQLFK